MSSDIRDNRPADPNAWVRNYAFSNGRAVHKSSAAGETLAAVSIDKGVGGVLDYKLGHAAIKALEHRIINDQLTAGDVELAFELQRNLATDASVETRTRVANFVAAVVKQGVKAPPPPDSFGR